MKFHILKLGRRKCTYIENDRKQKKKNSTNRIRMRRGIDSGKEEACIHTTRKHSLTHTCLFCFLIHTPLIDVYKLLGWLRVDTVCPFTHIRILDGESINCWCSVLFVVVPFSGPLRRLIIGMMMWWYLHCNVCSAYYGKKTRQPNEEKQQRRRSKSVCICVFHFVGQLKACLFHWQIKSLTLTHTLSLLFFLLLNVIQQKITSSIHTRYVLNLRTIFCFSHWILTICSFFLDCCCCCC